MRSTLFRQRAVPAGPKAKRAARPSVDGLEERLALATDLAITSISAINPTTVSVQYQVTDTAPAEPVNLAIYRSADRTFDASDTVFATKVLTAAESSVGAHTLTVALDRALDINPSKPFVLAVVDPANGLVETDETNNTDPFRIFTVAAVTHGYQPDAQFPAWVTQAATGLRGQGYDVAIPYDWALLSALPTPGLVGVAAQGLAARVTQAATSQLAGLTADDMVDVHLIAHSRGGGMIGQAAGLLNSATTPSAIKAGFLKLTLLDPHPAGNLNRPVPFYSASVGPLGRYAERLFLAFQAAVNDAPLSIPANVNLVEAFYQHAQARLTQGGIDEKFVNSWGEVPFVNAAARSKFYDVTALVPSHVGVYVAYISRVIPTLGQAGAIPFAETAPPIPLPTGGGGAVSNGTTNAQRAAGQRYEAGILNLGASRRIRSLNAELFRRFNTLDQALDRDDLRGARRQFNQLDQFVTRNARTFGPVRVATIRGPLQLGRVLLLPPAVAT